MRLIYGLFVVCVSTVSFVSTPTMAQVPGSAVSGSAPVLPATGQLIPPATRTVQPVPGLQPALQGGVTSAAAPQTTLPSVGASQSCLPVGRNWPEERVSAIIGSPVQLLTRSPLGGGQLSGEVRGVVATQPDTLEAMMTLVPSANTSQKIAIGVGLAGAALACVQSRPDIAGAIQARVVALGDAELQAAFADTTGGPTTAATGFAGSRSTSAPSGPAPALGSGFAPGSFGGATFEGAINAQSNLFRNTFSSSFDSTSAARNSAIGSVSPTQP
jgi:hypothetical protein